MLVFSLSSCRLSSIIVDCFFDCFVDGRNNLDHFMMMQLFIVWYFHKLVLPRPKSLSKVVLYR